MLKKFKSIFFILLLIICKNTIYAETLNVAVASNFLNTFKIISQNFEKHHECKIIISSDSTINLFTKIKNGAPFDIFISADAKHAELLETPFIKSETYAYGKIILWQKNFKIKKNMLILLSSNNIFSIANYKLSPYGNASKVLIYNINFRIKHIVLGENINHVFKYIYSNNSQLGITALSHIIYYKINKYYTWRIPQYLYPKIIQKMIALNDTKNELKLMFINYMTSNHVKFLIKSHGYNIEND